MPSLLPLADFFLFLLWWREGMLVFVTVSDDVLTDKPGSG